MMTIKVGEKAPDFTLTDHNGEIFNLSDNLGRGGIVIYFYPRDNTPGCTTEAKSFRDLYEDFRREGAEVVGISSDGSQKHREFAGRHELPFRLLSDEEGKIRKLYGIPKTLGIIPGRVTFVLDDLGIVRLVFDSQTKVSEHVDRALEIIRGL